MTTMASQITSLTVVYSTVYSDADQRNHQSSASLAFVWGIHRDRWIPRTKGQLRGKCFHLMTSSWYALTGPPPHGKRLGQTTTAQAQEGNQDGCGRLHPIRDPLAAHPHVPGKSPSPSSSTATAVIIVIVIIIVTFIAIMHCSHGTLGNIGWDDVMLPDGAKPLPTPMLTQRIVSKNLNNAT